jgi:hypothetical protein
MPVLFRLELDIVCETATMLDSFAYAQSLAKHGLKAQLVDPQGPGGGHPVFAFTGTRDALRDMLLEYYNVNLDELKSQDGKETDPDLLATLLDVESELARAVEVGETT